MLDYYATPNVRGYHAAVNPKLLMRFSFNDDVNAGA